MRTLVPGSSIDKHRGFTLVELMVAVLVASVLFGFAVLSIKSLDRNLQIEAQRITQLLGYARDYAQMRGRAVRFEADDKGYRFVIRQAGEWALVLDDPVLRERQWDKNTTVRIERFGQNQENRSYVEFGRDYVDSPFKLWLSQEAQKLAVASNGLGRFQVEQEATQ